MIEITTQCTTKNRIVEFNDAFFNNNVLAKYLDDEDKYYIQKIDYAGVEDVRPEQSDFVV